MVENSPADLVMLAGDVAITVTREEHHQAVLAYYGPDRRVVVELTWCAITTGKYRGQRAIEVRLDGRRVGELTYLMSQRYAPLVTQVNARGGRAGCEATIERDARGLQLTLRLPSDTDPPTVRVPAATTTFAAAPIPAPTARPLAMAGAAPARTSPGNTFTRHPTAWGIGLAVFVILVFAGIVGGGDKEQSAAPAAADETTTAALPTTTVVPPTSTTTTTTTPPPPPPTTTTQVAPPPAPVTEEPAPAPAQPLCDPNYSGCVPIASDVDCAGGSGNGPAYADGPVRVIGSDIYDLDKDHDGTACE